MRARPKLLYLVSEDWYFVSHRLALAVAAQAAGYDVSVATRVNKDGDTIRKAGLRLLPITFERAGLGPVLEAQTLARLIALYRRERPDIVHHVSVKPVIYGSIAARASGVRGVVNALMGLGFVFSSNSCKARALRPFVRASLRLALAGQQTRVVVQNGDDYQLMIAHALAREQNLRLIRGSGVDPLKFRVTPTPPGPPVFVLPARLLKDKGVVEFVTAAQLVKDRGIAARFALVGEPDPLNPASVTQGEIEAWVESSSVEHWGWKTPAAMPGILAASHVVCLPTFYGEGLPKSLLEAASCGRAIIATDVPGCREIVRHGVNGWLIAPRDPRALADAMCEAMADPARCDQYGAAGREMVVAEFSIDHVIEQMLAVYAEFHT